MVSWEGRFASDGFTNLLLGLAPVDAEDALPICVLLASLNVGFAFPLLDGKVFPAPPAPGVAILKAGVWCGGVGGDYDGDEEDNSEDGMFHVL